MLKRQLILLLLLLWAFAHPAWAVKYKGDLEANESLTLPEQSGTPASPAAGKHKFYIRDDGSLYSLDSAGFENPVGRRGLKNLIINGKFRIWQRATNTTIGGYAAADRWLVTFGAGAAVTTSRQSFTLGQTDVPGEPEFYIDLNRTTAGTTASTLRQRMEDVRTMAGQTVTLSFYAKASAAFDISTDFNQIFGTGGSPSAGWDGPDKAHSLTTSWQKFTHTVAIPGISGKTLGTNNDDRLVVRFLWAQGNGATETISVANVQVEGGKTATEFEERPLPLELAMAQRYYEKSFPQGTDVVQNAGRTGAVEWPSTVTGAVSIVQPIRFRVIKRTVPTMSFWNPSAANSQARNQTDAADCSATSTSNTANSGFQIATTTNSAANPGDTLSLHWAADAEL